MTKYLLVETGRFLGSDDNVENMVLVQEDDGRTFHRATGDDLTKLAERFPDFFRNSRIPDRL